MCTSWSCYHIRPCPDKHLLPSCQTIKHIFLILQMYFYSKYFWWCRCMSKQPVSCVFEQPAIEKSKMHLFLWSRWDFSENIKPQQYNWVLSFDLLRTRGTCVNSLLKKRDFIFGQLPLRANYIKIWLSGEDRPELVRIN